MALVDNSAQQLAKEQHAIEVLARETEAPIEHVREIYRIEQARLEQVAKIKTYVPVLTTRRVRELLLEQNGAHPQAS